MPTYLYTCICGEFAEISHPMNDEPKIICKTCYADMRKKPSISGIKFKGEGFYSNDSKEV